MKSTSQTASPLLTPAGPPLAARRNNERVNQLTDRLTDFDGVVLTDNEFDRRRLGVALAETDVYLAEIVAHRATLPS